MDEFTFSLSAWEDYCYWQGQDKKTLQKINELIKDIRRHGSLTGLGKPCPESQPPQTTDIDRYLDWSLDLLARYGDCARRHQAVVQAWPK